MLQIEVLNLPTLPNVKLNHQNLKLYVILVVLLIMEATMPKKHQIALKHVLIVSVSQCQS